MLLPNLMMPRRGLSETSWKTRGSRMNRLISIGKYRERKKMSGAIPSSRGKKLTMMELAP